MIEFKTNFILFDWMATTTIFDPSVDFRSFGILLANVRWCNEDDETLRLKSQTFCSPHFASLHGERWLAVQFVQRHYEK